MGILNRSPAACQSQLCSFEQLHCGDSLVAQSPRIGDGDIFHVPWDTDMTDTKEASFEKLFTRISHRQIALRNKRVIYR